MLPIDNQPAKGRSVNNVTLNAEQKLYVIASGSGFSCFGFANARDHSNQIAEQLGRTDLTFTPSDYSTLAGHHKHEAAVRAWGESALGQQTYFDPGTNPKVMAVLKSCLKTASKVRLILGDTATGEPWPDEFDVVGRIGRSGGWLKVPLLMQDGESGGGAILTACILGIVDWGSGRWLYRHRTYRVPDLSLKRTDDAEHP